MMKTLLVALLLLVSATSLVWQRHARHPKSRIIQAPSRTPDRASRPMPDTVPHPGAETTTRPATTPTPSDPWEPLRTGDLPSFIRSLRSTGCPDETLRLFAAAAAARPLVDRIEAPLRDAMRTSVWWRLTPTAPWKNLPETTRHARNDLDRAMVALVGQSAEPLRREMAGQPGRPADWLGPAQRTALDALRERHRDEIEDFAAENPHGQAGSGWSDTRRSQLRSLRERQADEARALLGDDAFAEYSLREGPASDFVRWELPEARDEAEFRRMVQAAIDIGADRLLARSMVETRHLPPDALPDRPADPREQVLARFREMNSPENNAEFDQAQAAEKARTEAEETARQEADTLAHLATLARAGGVRIDEQEARSLADALRRRGAELDREWGEPPKLPSPAERAALEDRIARELETVAASVLGDRGRAIARELRRREAARGSR